MKLNSKSGATIAAAAKRRSIFFAIIFVILAGAPSKGNVARRFEIPIDDEYSMPSRELL